MNALLARGSICLLNVLVLAPIAALALSYAYAVAAGLNRAALAKTSDNTLWYAMAVFAVVLWILQSLAFWAWFRFGRGSDWWQSRGIWPRLGAGVIAALAGAGLAMVSTWFMGAVAVLVIYAK